MLDFIELNSVLKKLNFSGGISLSREDYIRYHDPSFDRNSARYMWQNFGSDINDGLSVGYIILRHVIDYVAQPEMSLSDLKRYAKLISFI